MRHAGFGLFVILAVAGCASQPAGNTLAGLEKVDPDVEDVRVEDGLEKAILGYSSFLEETQDSPLTPEAMRRLADLKVEKEYGLLGDGEIREMPAPATGLQRQADSSPPGAAPPSTEGESDQEFESRTTAADAIGPMAGPSGTPLPSGQSDSEASGPLEAIRLYDEILARYPHYEHNDLVLYQKARAYDELGQPDEAMAVMDLLVAEYPGSRHADETQFRRAEYFFMRRKYFDAEDAYAAVVGMGPVSEYYELALYKLGWALYKQEMHEEALDQYTALLDFKLEEGYDFDAASDEHEERRVEDTFRVISLSFSNLGGPEVVADYFAENGNRSYEDRIYSRLGEFYFEKLRYADAAGAYKAFVELYPVHESSPHFGMRIVEIYDAGGFPKLVLESKKDFAARYDLRAEYWQHHDPADSPEVLGFLKSNLDDLASHYHALYQDEALEEDRPANYGEARHWYEQYLASFPQDPDTPPVNYRLADLLLENEDFSLAAHEYERTAYDYELHEQAPAAGYAAIFARRQHQDQVGDAGRAEARRLAVTSTLRFIDAFPQHEHAAVVLGAAVDDLYDMQEYATAIERGRQLIDNYPGADPAIVRSAWAAVANAYLDTAQYVEAEHAYSQLLALTPDGDEARQGVVDNLAAAIYKQGEESNVLGDYRAAADHFLRIRAAAPTSAVRPAAEYDAAAALMKLEDWSGAAEVLEAFREAFPEHELHGDATRQIAFAYREDGRLVQAAEEYVQVADQAEEPELRREALLEAADLFEQAGADASALNVYLVYVDEFPEPVADAVEVHNSIAEKYEALGDGAARRQHLAAIVELDAAAGAERTPRTRYLAAHASLTLAQHEYETFAAVELVQPFERSLEEKQALMDALLARLEGLVDYEVAEVTAAATFYIGETYYDFSQSLLDSERPADLTPAELADYDMVIEEEAFPFEELAIEVHEKNLELLVSGVFNPWVENSLDKLAELMPGRYAKFEISPGFLASLESYAYQVPNAPAPLPEADDADAAEERPAGAEETAGSSPGVEASAPAAGDTPNQGGDVEAPASDEGQQTPELPDEDEATTESEASGDA
ncbi:MAG: tetratricopeptide repeat protein [Gammaproteobacteria bacterium]